MAMTKEAMATKIIDHLEALLDWGASESYARPFIEAFCQGIIDEVVQNATITMNSGDFSVNPNGTPPFKDSLNVQITGLGTNESFALTGKIS